MYDVGCTMYDCDYSALCAKGAERMQSGILKAVRGRGYKAAKAPSGAHVRCTTEALGSAYVRSTKYDVRLRCSRALRGNLAEREASAPAKADALGNCVCRLFDSFLLESLALGS